MRIAIVLIILLTTPAALAADAHSQLQSGFAQTIAPFLTTYCTTCHSGDKPKGDLDLSVYTSLESMGNDPRRWELVVQRLEDDEMPPAKAKAHPPADLRHQVIDWLRALRKDLATRNAGDPGPVFARRLSNAEYDYTVRDLTGVDIAPAREFPVDPANEAGFDNSAESLTMSPGPVKKYLQAARSVADHLVLKPDGFEFAPHPVVADTDRDKFCVNRIIAFYKRQHTDYADYFFAAWRVRNGEKLAEATAQSAISPKYLATICSTLTENSDDIGPIAALTAMWREFPNGNDERSQAAVRAGCERMRDFAVQFRAKLVPKVNNLTAPPIHNGSQPMVLWKDRQMAANRMRYAGGALDLSPSGLPEGSAAAKAMAIPADPAARERYEDACNRFCAIVPDAFYVSERARVYLDPEKEKKLAGRLLSAGFHSQMGYFRDDGPLYQLILSQDEQRELDRLWQELDFIASAPIRQYTGFLWFDRTDSRYMRDPEFDFARAEDKDCTSPAKMMRLEELYVAKARSNGASDTALQAIHDYFNSMSRTFRWLERAHAEAEPTHLRDLTTFAQRAYRRPLSSAERDDLVAFYKSLREKDGLTHEEAMRDTITAILMSPHFCYRLDLPRAGETKGGTIRPLDDIALASRLSYFLWSSMPDQTLMDLAATGELHRPEVLLAQARRMLHDPRVRGLATEFAGNWLDFRRFEEHNGVDRGRFPAFDNDLRRAMFEEPIRFFIDVAQRDRSVLDFLFANDTFVNATLARHYGMPVPSTTPDQWVQIDNADRYGRGGLLPMAVFLTKNAPGLRTSPVKRGNWIVRRVLGERIPPPPPTVPLLPTDESKLGDLTLRETLARHRADPTCAQCHERFDSMGLVFEGYGPIGELRDKDLGGKPVDTRAAFPRGAGEGTGLEGLRVYLRHHRQNDFIDNLCRQLLAYGLGRTLLPSDDQLLEQMRAKLIENGYHFDTLIECIVTSPQFLNRRDEIQK
jgi:hypothetical protein